MVGRGAKFQRAYASVYPGKLLIYARPVTDPKAAIRDPQLHKALRQAGHAVSVIEDWALLEQALKTVAGGRRPAGRRRGCRGSSRSSPPRPRIPIRCSWRSRRRENRHERTSICGSSRRIAPSSYLDEVESTMKSRSKQAKAH